MYTNCQKYFAYGSNLNLKDFTNWCDRRNITDAKLAPISQARVVDYQLAFSHKSVSRGGGALNIERQTGSVVEGILFDVQGTEGWSALDRKEGAPNHYERIDVQVLLENGDTASAITYVNPRVAGDYVKPTDDYVQLVQEGLANFDLSDRSLRAAASYRNPDHFTDAVFVYDDLMRGGAGFNHLRQQGIKYITGAECHGKLLLANDRQPVLHRNHGRQSRGYEYAEGEFMRLANAERSLQFLDGLFAEMNERHLDGVNLTRTLRQVCLSGKKVRWAWVYETNTPCDGIEEVKAGCWRTHLGEKSRFWTQLSASHAESFTPGALEALHRLNPWDQLRARKSGESITDYLAELLSTGAITELRLLQASGRDIAVW